MICLGKDTVWKFVQKLFEQFLRFLLSLYLPNHSLTVSFSILIYLPLSLYLSLSIYLSFYLLILPNLLLTLPLFLVGHDVGYYGPPFFPVGSNFCASVYVHSCISGDVSQPSASLPSSTAFAIYHAFCDYTL